MGNLVPIIKHKNHCGNVHATEAERQRALLPCFYCLYIVAFFIPISGDWFKCSHMVTFLSPKPTSFRQKLKKIKYKKIISKLGQIP